MEEIIAKNYKEPATSEPLISVIQQNQILLIDSNGKKSSKKSGRGWIFVDVEGREILSGFNTDFGNITQINSHRADIYGALSVFIFLHEYCKVYKMNPQSPIKYYCDNKEVVTKLNNITERNRNYYSSNSKIKDLYAVLEIQKYIPTTVMVTHIRGHQDKKKMKEQLIMAESLNIMADGIIGKNASTPKSIHIRRTPMAIYTNKTYIPNNIRNGIQSHCGSQSATRFLKEKYQ